MSFKKKRFIKVLIKVNGGKFALLNIHYYYYYYYYYYSQEVQHRGCVE